MAGEGIKKATILSWKQSDKEIAWRINLLFGHTLNGTITADEKQACVIDDLGMFPAPKWIDSQREGKDGMTFGVFNDEMKQNSIRTYDLQSGKLFNVVGSWRYNELFKKEAPPKSGVCHFLSPPIPFQNRRF